MVSSQTQLALDQRFGAVRLLVTARRLWTATPEHSPDALCASVALARCAGGRANNLGSPTCPARAVGFWLCWRTDNRPSSRTADGIGCRDQEETTADNAGTYDDEIVRSWIGLLPARAQCRGQASKRKIR